MSAAEEFVCRVREIAREGEPEDALDLIYQTLDRWMRGGRFIDVSEALLLADPAALPLVVAIAYASATRPARDYLAESRADYLARLIAHDPRAEEWRHR